MHDLVIENAHRRARPSARMASGSLTTSILVMRYTSLLPPLPGPAS